MTAKQSTKAKKPRKPYPAYPLRTHDNGQWVKKIRGVVRCCGVWSDPAAALKVYKANRVYWETGTTPKDQEPEGLTVKRAINTFLDRLESKVDDGDRSRRHFEDCKRTADIIVSTLDKHRLLSDLNGADFFTLRQRFEKRQDGKKTSPVTLQGHIRRTIIIFNFCIKEGLIDRVVYGADFRGLSERQKNQIVAKSANRLLDAKTIRTLIDSANYRFKAMLLLGVNCGLGNKDIGALEFGDVDLKSGWLEADRSKTAVRRCSKLWPETITALEVVYRKRFEPGPDAENRIFVTRHKRPFSDQAAITHEFTKLAKKCKLKLPAGCGFYSLRHSCRTVANKSADTDAKRWIVGHKRDKIDDTYVHEPPKERIELVCNHVRQWLFDGTGGAA